MHLIKIYSFYLHFYQMHFRSPLSKWFHRFWILKNSNSFYLEKMLLIKAKLLKKVTIFWICIGSAFLCWKKIFSKVLKKPLSWLNSKKKKIQVLFEFRTSTDIYPYFSHWSYFGLSISVFAEFYWYKSNFAFDFVCLFAKLACAFLCWCQFYKLSILVFEDSRNFSEEALFRIVS